MPAEKLRPDDGRLVPEELLKQAVDLVEQHGSQSAAAKASGISLSTLNERYRKAVARGYSPKHGLREMYPAGFKMPKTTIQRNAQGEIERTWERMTEDREAVQAALQEMVAGMADDLPRVKPTPRSRGGVSKDLLNVIPFGDPHFGMYAWAAECGEDFDLDIAKRDLCGAVAHLVGRAPRAQHCVLANLGDFFHADNMAGITSHSGNILDMDTRLPKMVRIGVSAFRTAIHTALRQHNTVEVVNSAGNHDEVLGFVLSILLADVYENEPRLIVRQEPTWRHYVEFGKVLLGFVHGDKTKDGQLPGIMAAEQPEAWGRTRHRFFYRGHHHQTKVTEYNGCIVEQFRTLAPSDSYAVSHGYLSGRDMHALTFHREGGLVGRQVCSVDMLRTQYG